MGKLEINKKGRVEGKKHETGPHARVGHGISLPNPSPVSVPASFQKELPQKEPFLSWINWHLREKERDGYWRVIDVDMKRIRLQGGGGVGGSSRDGLGLINKSSDWFDWLPGFCFLCLWLLSFLSFFSLPLCLFWKVYHPSWVCLLWHQRNAKFLRRNPIPVWEWEPVHAGVTLTVRESESHKHLSGGLKFWGVFSRILKDTTTPTGFFSAPSKAKRPFRNPHRFFYRSRHEYYTDKPMCECDNH